MLDVVLSNRFKKDLKLAAKRKLNLEILNEIVDKLAAGETLPDKSRDHALSGNFLGFRECHIQPDWLLVYRIEDRELLLFLFRTGTHSDLFSYHLREAGTASLFSCIYHNMSAAVRSKGFDNNYLD